MSASDKAVALFPPHPNPLPPIPIKKININIYLFFYNKLPIYDKIVFVRKTKTQNRMSKSIS